MLNDDFWSQRYDKQEIAWDIGAVSPPLKQYIDQIEDKDIRILIPGCGNAYEAEYLLENGFNNVTLVDISSSLIQILEQKFYPKYKNKLHLLHSDFFDLVGKFDLIIEQTFFCALMPEMRPNYVLKMRDLLEKDAKLVGLMFNRSFQNDGPPFGGSAEEYQAYFSKYFKLKYFSDCYNSIPPRQGSELFICLVRS